MSNPYSSIYYERLKEDSSASATAVIPIIKGLFHPTSVIDVGCGSGTWARVYLESGCKVLGVDGNVVRGEQLLIPEEMFERHDLSKPFKLGRQFDLVNCLEVAEHLAKERADGFVEDLCRLSPVVVFSAAIPGQGGTHHVNEQWPDYWIPKFRSQGFKLFDCLRHLIWENREVAWWYAQNILVFVRADQAERFKELADKCRGLPVNLVHPRAYLAATVPSEMSPRMLREVVRALPYFPGKILRHFTR